MAAAKHYPMKKIPLLVPLVALLVVPFFLRRRIRVVRRILIRVRPEVVFPFINDLRNWPLWTGDARSNGAHFSYSGPPSGVGATKEWSIDRREARLRVQQSQPDERLTYELEVDHGRRVVEGIIALEPVDGLTRLRWIVKWEGSESPFGRYGDLWNAWRAGRRLDAALANLREIVEREAGRPRGPGDGGGLAGQ